MFFKGNILKQCLGNNFFFFNHHLKAMCNFHEPTYDLYLKWFAHIIQYPERPPQIVPVFSGEQGDGKDMQFDTFKPGMESHYWECTDCENQFFGRFNGMLKNKFLVNLSELSTYAARNGVSCFLEKVVYFDKNSHYLNSKC